MNLTEEEKEEEKKLRKNYAVRDSNPSLNLTPLGRLNDNHYTNGVFLLLCLVAHS